MKVAVLSEVRFCRVGDGSVSANASPYLFWTRDLGEFDEVPIVGREERASKPHPGMVRVDGPRALLFLTVQLAAFYPLAALWMWQRVRSGRGRQAAVSPAGSFLTSIAVRGGSMNKRPAPALIRNGRPAAPSVAGAVRS